MDVKQSFIDSLISKMTIEQKIGQCLVIGFVGTMITPEIIRRIHCYQPAGIRVGLTLRTKTAIYDPLSYDQRSLHKVIRNPKGTVKDFCREISVPWCTNEEFCGFLNTLKQAAQENGTGIPVHITLDMEGDASADYCRGGIHYFPSVMGISKTGDPKLAYDIAWAIARQLVPLGFNWIHSPVLDVNTNPLNPEIGTRSYSEDFEEVIKFALESIKGFRDGGLITTGKHFPGRGASADDAHAGLPVINEDLNEMQKHIAPYRAMIKAGIPAIMTAHTAYPALDPSGLPATLSKPILTHLLKEELGFNGVISTDDITMGGIIQKYEVAEACILTLNAGADLILFRDEGNLIDEVFPELVNAVCMGKIKEERLDDAVRRTLGVKYDYGLFKNNGVQDVSKAGSGINDEKVSRICADAAKRTVFIIRDEDSILPVAKSANILLVEQIHRLHEFTNTQACHPGLLWEKMLKHSDRVSMVEIRAELTEEDRKRVLRRTCEAEVIVMTNYYFRGHSNGNELVKELYKLGKPVIVVTNSPYSFSVQPEFKTVIINYGASPESFAEVAGKIFGE